MDFGNTSGIRSPFSPRVRQAITGRRNIGSAKKNPSKFLQSQDAPNGGDVIYKTPLCSLETYGMPLPVMVTETLTFASGDVSVRLSACGWCWLVVGRRILAWPREPMAPSGLSSPSVAAPAAARELTLPQTDLAHKADLVVIFYEEGAQMPSCIGVSPEGTARYWPSVAQERGYVDVSAELAGQECDRLGERTSAGLVLATTTCTVVLLDPVVVEGRASVQCRTLRPPSGWLGGLGRRVSLLFFGAMPAHADTKLVGVVVLESDAEGAPSVALVAGGGGGPLLQLWRGAELHGHALRRQLHAHAHALSAAQGDVNSVDIMALDVRAAGPHGLLLLLAAVNVRAPDMRYAIAHVSVEDPTNPRVTSLVSLRTGPSAGVDPDLLPRFLPLNGRVLLYSTNYVALVSSANDKSEYIDVSSENDRILGAELCGSSPLVFSRKHGVLALVLDDSGPRARPVADTPLSSVDMYDDSLSLYEIDPHEVSAVTTDACGKLKTAFLFHVRRDNEAARRALAELWPAAGEGEEGGELDATVLKIATEILDDIPAGDPRWKQRVTGQSANIALGSSAALETAAQLRDKQRAFSLFVEFLRGAGLGGGWRRPADDMDESVISTESALCRLSEKLAAAAALRRLHRGSAAQLIDAAIYQVVCGESAGEEDPETEAALASGALTPADVCYRRVSKIERVLRALAKANSLDIITTVLTEMQAARAAWPQPQQQHSAVALTLLPALLDLHKRTFTQYLGNCKDATSRAALLQAAAALAELLLSAACALPASRRARVRALLIQPFLEEGQISRAAALAEKFQHLELLIEICISSDDSDRLYAYIDKYINEGMCEKAFAWLCSRSGRLRALLLRRLGRRYPERLVSWLSAAPQPPRPALLALQQLARGRHRLAAEAYAALAHDETDSNNRMATMASLAKLCLVASDEDQPTELWNKIESRLALSEQHTALPRDIRVHNGLDSEDTRVLPPEDLVQMYIDSESQLLSEYDYKKALDLTDYITDVERRDELRLKVWSASARAAREALSARAQPRDLTFFRLADLARAMGSDLEVLLPPVEDILAAPELQHLSADPRFCYIMKYGYECLRNTDAD
ncbi:nuclear pore complex protein Nup133 isoform X2 [Plodia interpunctella]|uniref:nuclear pore complex protein Nup133 isoform X2 n=1 Tax=Plodia interpunctella TaxID=58824 RepID=UPI0023675D81|nr:nuclear pore complex protein Nup133 isoform X2 [Plodia interpunctella]